MELDTLFASFLKSGLYLKNWSPKTVRAYRQAFSSFQQSLRVHGPELPAATGSDETQQITKAQLEAWVASLRSSMSPGGVGCYVRAMNSFLSWLKEEGILKEHLKLKIGKIPEKPIEVLSASDVRVLSSGRGRTWVLIQTLMDTGLRIEEALTLQTSDVDFDNLMLKVLGKGNKKRIVPFSQELRKILWRHVNRQNGYVFSTGAGHRLSYRNAYRDIQKFCRLAGVTRHVHPHLFRHTFATHYLKAGGDPFRLRQVLGHSQIQTTLRYTHLQPQDLVESHSRLSLLSRRRGI